jgi:hypothetical protein
LAITLRLPDLGREASSHTRRSARELARGVGSTVACAGRGSRLLVGMRSPLGSDRP